MRDLLKKIILYKRFRKALRKIVNVAVDSDEELFESILDNQHQHLQKITDIYPSPFNYGYNHIDKTIKLARALNFDPSGAILDIGAANGETSQRFSSAFPDATVYAYEPILENFEELKQNTGANPKIKIFNMALGNSTEEKVIHLTTRRTSSSILNVDSNIKNDFFAENLANIGEQKIIIKKLDDEIPKSVQINIIKMDVQGYELEVLKGGGETLKRTKMVVVEMQNHELYKGAPKYFDLDLFLRNEGFELYDIIPSIREDHKLYEWDGIYVNIQKK